MKFSPNDKGHHRPTQLLTAIFHFLLFFHRPPFLSPLLSPLLSSGKLTGSSVEERKARGEVKRAWGEDARLKFRVSSTYLYSPPFNLSSPSFFFPFVSFLPPTLFKLTTCVGHFLDPFDSRNWSIEWRRRRRRGEDDRNEGPGVVCIFKGLDSLGSVNFIFWWSESLGRLEWASIKISQERVIQTWIGTFLVKRRGGGGCSRENWSMKSGFNARKTFSSRNDANETYEFVSRDDSFWTFSFKEINEH